jgi:hypothetical protein
MATLAKNNVYLALDGVDVSGVWVSVKPKGKNNTRETTAGANTTHVQRQPGLNDYSFDVSFAYDDATIASYIQKLKPGAVVSMEYAPDGRTAGKPKHIQSVIVDSVDGEQNVDKSPFIWSGSLLGAAAPSFDMWAGATY